MKPDNISSVFLASSDATPTSSLLYQCANFFSKQGVKVLYISSTPLDKLPAGIHGILQPDSATIGQIRFLYLPHYEELLKQLFSIHLHVEIPQLIIVDRLDNYCRLTNSADPEKYDHEVHCAQICAALLDTTSVCAKCIEREASLVVSYEVTPGQENIVNMLIDLFFNSVVWVIERVPSQDNETNDLVSMRSLPCPSSKKQVSLEFRSTDESLILEKVKNFIGIRM